jgi:hypothetical protein
VRVRPRFTPLAFLVVILLSILVAPVTAQADGLPSGLLPESSYPGPQGQIAQKPPAPGLWTCVNHPAIESGVVGTSLGSAKLILSPISSASSSALAGLSATLSQQASNLEWHSEGDVTQLSGLERPISGFCLIQFAGMSSPVGLLALSLSGNWCATWWRFLIPSSQHTLQVIDLNACTYQAEVFDADGHPLILTNDFDFIGRLPGHGDGGMAPTKLYALKDGMVADVTRDHLDVVRADAAKQWQTYQHSRRDGPSYGVLAAWAGDECNLGDGRSAWGRLIALDRHGAFSGKPVVEPGGTWPTGTSYLSYLRSFLKSHGYCSSLPLRIG